MLLSPLMMTAVTTTPKPTARVGYRDDLGSALVILARMRSAIATQPSVRPKPSAANARGDRLIRGSQGRHYQDS
jgi:hypothetical protein